LLDFKSGVSGQVFHTAGQSPTSRERLNSKNIGNIIEPLQFKSIAVL